MEMTDPILIDIISGVETEQPTKNLSYFCCYLLKAWF